MNGLHFLVIGAQKSGTTTLWKLLRDHPGLALPAAKEAPFFTDDGAFARGLEAYLDAHFAGAGRGALRGTVTPSYMKGVAGPATAGMPVERVAARIAATVPRAKLIALLRDPIERAISHHRMSVRRMLEPRPLQRALREQLAPGALAAARHHPTETNSYVVAGEYGRILAAYREHFPAEQILVAFTSELDADPGALLGRVLAFLGVDAGWRPSEIEQRHLVGGEETRLPAAEAEGLLTRVAAAVPEELRGGVQLAFEDWNTIARAADTELPQLLELTLRGHFAADGARLEELIATPVPWASEAPPPPRAPAVGRPRTSLVILAHDTPQEVEALLASIVRNTDGEYEIILLDNGSSPRGRRLHTELAGTYNARLIALDANLTFSIANNVGIQVSSGEDIVFLNSDVLVTRDWLTNLRTALHSAPDIGAVGPRTTFSRAAQAGIWLDAPTDAGVEQFGRFFNHSDPGRWFELDWLAGFALLVRREALDAVGGFDESIPWHGLEDKALGEALTAAGWRSLCAGDTFVYHAGHRTFDVTSMNRTATRFERPAVDSGAPTGDGRLVRDAGGLVFELRDGVAHHLEAPPALLGTGRTITDAAPGELEQLPVGPPVSLYRGRHGEGVWLLHVGIRRAVRGDADRIRRLPFVSTVDRRAIWRLPKGPELRVEDAIPPVPKIDPRLPSNPAVIDPQALAGADRVAADVGDALAQERGYALIRLGRAEALVLNHGMWPAPRIDRAASGVRHSPRAAAAALRRAIIGADAVGVSTDRSEFAGAAMLEHVLFHYDLYPRLRCAETIGEELLRPADEDPASSLLARLLRGRRLALVCPTALALASRQGNSREAQRRAGLEIGLAVGLDDTRQVDFAVDELAGARVAYDAVLVSAEVAGKLICTRLARQLDVVALDIGRALGKIVHPRYDRGMNPLVGLSGEVEAYLTQLGFPPPDPPHPLEGRLVRAGGEREIYYIERGEARELLDESLLALFHQAPEEVGANTVLALARGLPLCAVHEPLSGTYVLLDGRKLRVRTRLPVVTVPDMALASVPDDDRELAI